MATASGSGGLRNHRTDEESLRLLFNDIFQSYEQPLFRLAANLCKDNAMARDIIHDVFLKLWEIRQQIHEIQSIEAFLFTLTRNRVMDYLRKAASDARLKQAIWESMQQVVVQQPNAAEQKEFNEILAKAVDRLPPQRKAVYLLRDAGYDYNEIADRLHISRHTVKNQLSAAFKSIRDTFNRLF